IVVTQVTKLSVEGWKFPLIVKPNYEGSSMGITIDSIVETEDMLRTRVVELLARYPAGVLVEEFIVGQDLVVPYLEKACPETGGVLEPALYECEREEGDNRKYQIYDFELKNLRSNAVHVEVPAKIPPQARTRAMELGRTIFKALGIRDVGRIDFRLCEDGQIYFIEVNA